jgi:hypothetical protein
MMEVYNRIYEYLSTGAYLGGYGKNSKVLRRKAMSDFKVCLA